MARDTRGPVPGETTDMRRVSLTASHWHRGRWWLIGQAGVLAVLAIAVVAVLATGRNAAVVADVRIGWPLALTLLGVAIASGFGALWRRLALLVTVTVGVGALLLVVVCAVAATHHSHPFGSTTAVLLVWATLFCYDSAIAVWLVPDHIEGPAWVFRRRSRGAASIRTPEDSA